MIALVMVFMVFLFFFGFIGASRGWAKEVLVIASVILALALITLMEDLLKLNQIIKSEIFPFILRMPAQESHVVDQCLRENPPLQPGEYRTGPLTLGLLLPFLIQNQRQMGKGRRFPTEIAVEQEVLGN